MAAPSTAAFADCERVTKLLTDTVVLLCQNSLSFTSEIHVQGLLGVTIDRSTVILCQVSERTVKAAGSSETRQASDVGLTPQQPTVTRRLALPAPPSQPNVQQNSLAMVPWTFGSPTQVMQRPRTRMPSQQLSTSGRGGIRGVGMVRGGRMIRPRGAVNVAQRMASRVLAGARFPVARARMRLPLRGGARPMGMRRGTIQRLALPTPANYIENNMMQLVPVRPRMPTTNSPRIGGAGPVMSSPSNQRPGMPPSGLRHQSPATSVRGSPSGVVRSPGVARMRQMSPAGMRPQGKMVKSPRMLAIEGAMNAVARQQSPGVARQQGPGVLRQQMPQRLAIGAPPAAQQRSPAAAVARQQSPAAPRQQTPGRLAFEAPPTAARKQSPGVARQQGPAVLRLQMPQRLAIGAPPAARQWSPAAAVARQQSPAAPRQQTPGRLAIEAPPTAARQQSPGTVFHRPQFPSPTKQRLAVDSPMAVAKQQLPSAGTPRQQLAAFTSQQIAQRLPVQSSPSVAAYTGMSPNALRPQQIQRLALEASPAMVARQSSPVARQQTPVSNMQRPMQTSSSVAAFNPNQFISDFLQSMSPGLVRPQSPAVRPVQSSVLQQQLQSPQNTVGARKQLFPVTTATSVVQQQSGATGPARLQLPNTSIQLVTAVATPQTQPIAFAIAQPLMMSNTSHGMIMNCQPMFAAIPAGSGAGEPSPVARQPTVGAGNTVPRPQSCVIGLVDRQNQQPTSGTIRTPSRVYSVDQLLGSGGTTSQHPAASAGLPQASQHVGTSTVLSATPGRQLPVASLEDVESVLKILEKQQNTPSRQQQTVAQQNTPSRQQQTVAQQNTPSSHVLRPVVFKPDAQQLQQQQHALQQQHLQQQQQQQQQQQLQQQQQQQLQQQQQQQFAILQQHQQQALQQLKSNTQFQMVNVGGLTTQNNVPTMAYTLPPQQQQQQQQCQQPPQYSAVMAAAAAAQFSPWKGSSGNLQTTKVLVPCASFVSNSQLPVQTSQQQCSQLHPDSFQVPTSQQQVSSQQQTSTRVSQQVQTSMQQQQYVMQTTPLTTSVAHQQPAAAGRSECTTAPHSRPTVIPEQFVSGSVGKQGSSARRGQSSSTAPMPRAAPSVAQRSLSETSSTSVGYNRPQTSGASVSKRADMTFNDALPLLESAVLPPLQSHQLAVPVSIHMNALTTARLDNNPDSPPVLSPEPVYTELTPTRFLNVPPPLHHLPTSSPTGAVSNLKVLEKKMLEKRQAEMRCQQYVSNQLAQLGKPPDKSDDTFWHTNAESTNSLINLSMEEVIETGSDSTVCYKSGAEASDNDDLGHEALSLHLDTDESQDLLDQTASSKELDEMARDMLGDNSPELGRHCRAIGCSARCRTKTQLAAHYCERHRCDFGPPRDDAGRIVYDLYQQTAASLRNAASSSSQRNAASSSGRKRKQASTGSSAQKRRKVTRKQIHECHECGWEFHRKCDLMNHIHRLHSHGQD